MTLEDWYLKSRIENLPYSFMELVSNKWKGDLLSVIEQLFPEKDVEWWRMQRAPKGAWKNILRRHQYLKWLEIQLGFSKPSDWYQITMNDFYENYGGSLQTYIPSIMEVLKDFYPEYDFKPWLFKVAPNGTWQDKKNHRNFLLWVQISRNHVSFEDWYSISGDEIDSFGGSKLRQMYDSISDLIMSNLPEYKFQFWKFRKARGNWKSEKNQKEFIKWVEIELKINKPEDWYQVTENDIERLGGITLISGYFDDSISNCICSLFPEYGLKEEKFKFTGKMEMRLMEIVKDLLPTYEVIPRYKHPKMLFSSGRKMELDIFIPFFNLAFEYDGKQHHEVTSWGGEEAWRSIQERDIAKDNACKEMGISLFRIKYDEWEGDVGTIQSLIKRFLNQH